MDVIVNSSEGVVPYQMSEPSKIEGNRAYRLDCLNLSNMVTFGSVKETIYMCKIVNNKNQFILCLVNKYMNITWSIYHDGR